MKLKFLTFWAINAPLETRLLCDQLDRMKALGFDGAVFHPRFYPNEPVYLSDEYLAIVSDVILHAKSIGMDLWLYDENGWPSGTVGGELPARYPELAQQWVELSREKPDDCIGSFQRDGVQWYLGRRTGEGVDYLNPELARRFLEMTYDRYRDGLSAEAFKYVGAFFSDEPEFGLGHAFDSLSPDGAIPWTSHLPELYRKRYGSELTDILPLLFFDGGRHQVARVRFWELVTDVFCESFITPIDDWCRNHGKRFSAHVKGEEHPLFQIPTHGSANQVFQHIALPGIDALERYPSGHFFPRQVASVAQQFGNGDCMVEAFGGAGWGAGPEDLERYLEWLIDHGLNHFVIHLYQYKLTTHAMNDWPASTPAHVTWQAAYPELIARVRRRAESLPRPADTLVIAPYRGIMEAYEPREFLQTNIHNGSNYPMTAAGRINAEFLELLGELFNRGASYHIADERTVEEHGAFVNGALKIGHCEYRHIVIADGAKFDRETHLNLSRIAADGVPEALPAPTSAVPPQTELSIEWEVMSDGANVVVLEAQAVDDGFAAYFDANGAIGVAVEFLDDVGGVTLNGTPIAPGQPIDCIPRRNEIRFGSGLAHPVPFVCVRGQFSVKSLSPYVAGPNDTVKTEGPFVLTKSQTGDLTDLVASGMPFSDSPFMLRGAFELPNPVERLSLVGVHAACARIVIDGGDCGWCWGPNWSVTPRKPLASGRHTITVELVPSTFNLYGPHHHIDGDLPVTSPLQYDYIKNFADRVDAPENTRVTAWHFKPFGIAGGIAFEA